MLRLYRPPATVAFGKLDTLSPGYAAAADAARARGYAPVLRLPGGHAAAYHRESLGIDLVYALDDPVPGTHDRFRETGERLAGALASLGVDARVGEVPGEYCPGAYSVNARGRVKLVGTAQRLVRGAALLGAVIVVRDGEGVRAVLRDVYARLGLEWDDATAGAVDEEVPGLARRRRGAGGAGRLRGPRGRAARRRDARAGVAPRARAPPLERVAERAELGLQLARPVGREVRLRAVGVGEPVLAGERAGGQRAAVVALHVRVAGQRRPRRRPR